MTRKNNKRSINQLQAEAEMNGVVAPDISKVKTKEQKHNYLTFHRGWMVAAEFPSGMRYFAPTGQKGYFTLEEAWQQELSNPPITRGMFENNPDPFGMNPEDMRSVDRSRRRGRYNVPNVKVTPAQTTE